MRDLNEDFAAYERRIKELQDKLDQAQKMIEAQHEARNILAGDINLGTATLNKELQTRLDAVQHDRLDIQQRAEVWQQRSDMLERRVQAQTERANAAECRLGVCVEALECLLPGLTLDLRYASADDDKDAMRSRIKTVTDALQATVIETSAPKEPERKGDANDGQFV